MVEFTAKDVLPRPRIHVKYSLTDDEIEQFLRLLQEHAIHVIPPGEWRFCRDPDDDLILETAILGEARYAVSAGTSAAL